MTTFLPAHAVALRASLRSAAARVVALADAPIRPEQLDPGFEILDPPKYGSEMKDGGLAATWEGLCPTCAEPMLAVVGPGTESAVLKCFSCGLTTI